MTKRSGREHPIEGLPVDAENGNLYPFWPIEQAPLISYAPRFSGLTRYGPDGVNDADVFQALPISSGAIETASISPARAYAIGGAPGVLPVMIT